MEAFCPNCKTKTHFNKDRKSGKFTCCKCNRQYHKCNTNGCNNMISFGIFCSDCIGKGIKKAGAGTFVIVGGIVAIVVEGLRKK